MPKKRQTVLECAIERVADKHGWPKRDPASMARFAQLAFREAQRVMRENSRRMNGLMLSLPNFR